MIEARPRVLVSGLYAGPNPSPGVGTARSLRAAYPGGRLIGVDYSPRSTGLHWPEFDDVWIARPWDEIDLAEHRRQISERLSAGELWISGLDLEVRWLAKEFAGHPAVIGPPIRALRAVGKPPRLPGYLGLPTPPAISIAEPELSLHRFCREHDWQVWVKGPYYEARLVRGWAEFRAARDELTATWGSSSGIFAQAHVGGHEASILLAAAEGRLIDAVAMTKREVTTEGKTWAGSISPISAHLRRELARFVARIGWTGGAEVELVVDATGQPFVIEWNPRFPAWVYGATLAGFNLPGNLVAAMTGLQPRAASGRAHGFARVVLEIPTRPGLSLPVMPTPGPRRGAAGKHPSGMPDLARRMSRSRLHPALRTSPVGPPANWDAEFALIDTPNRVFLPRVASEALRRASASLSAASDAALHVTAALSIKTDPRDELLAGAVREGLSLEAISQHEVGAALRAGCRSENVILNGPAKWWPSVVETSGLGAIFFDSLSEGERYLDGSAPLPGARVIGARLRLPGVDSRFGIPLEDPRAYSHLLDLLRRVGRRADVGLHFHVASSSLGVTAWRRLFASALTLCDTITRTIAPVRMLDVGGGFGQGDWEDVVAPWLPEAARQVRRLVPSIATLMLEPGKALTQSSSILVTRVVDVRTHGGARDVVVDASVAELPLAQDIPRVVYRASAMGWQPLAPARGAILGRLCMEHDVLARGVDLAGVEVGATLVFSDAGAYDHSMAYRFGQASGD